MNQAISVVQIIIAILIIILILTQNRGSGAGAIFGGGGGPVHTKRGMEKWMHYATITLIIVFVILGVVSLLLR